MQVKIVICKSLVNCREKLLICGYYNLLIDYVVYEQFSSETSPGVGLQKTSHLQNMSVSLKLQDTAFTLLIKENIYPVLFVSWKLLCSKRERRSLLLECAGPQTVNLCYICKNNSLNQVKLNICKF